MKAKFTLEARVKQKFVRVEFKKNQPQPVAGAGAYYVRGTWNGKSQRKPLGADFDQAVRKFKNYETVRELQSKDLPVPGYLAEAVKEEEKEEPAKPKNVDQLIDEFLHHIDRDPEKTYGTYLHYRHNMQFFSAFCAKPPVRCPAFQFPALNLDVMKAYKAFLQTKHFSPNTVHGIFQCTVIFLNWCKLNPNKWDEPLKTKHWPKLQLRRPEKYSEDELAALFAASGPNERLLWECFYATGMRKGEMAHAVYGDIDFQRGRWHVTRKPKWNWVPKKDKERDFPVPFWLLRKIKVRMDNAKRTKADLIFPGRDGKPSKGILSKLKVCSKRAKLDCGRIDVHKFRATAITRWLESGRDVFEVMHYVGHDKPDTILHYKVEADLNKPEVHAAATAAFPQLAAPAPVAVAAD